jgi:hypothetical protein
MSTVTDILVLTPLDDIGTAEMNEKMKAAGWPVLKEISKAIKCGKAFQAEIWAIAINGFDLEWFFSMTSKVQWGDRANIQLAIKQEWEDRFNIFSLSGGTVADQVDHIERLNQSVKARRYGKSETEAVS